MTDLVAFLRGINLGNRRVKMVELRKHAEAMGLEDVRSYLASGNLLFRAPSEGLPELERRMEVHLEERLGFFTDTMIRTLARVRELTEHPVVTEAEGRGLNVYVTFAKTELGADVRQAFEALETTDDSFVVLEREVLWLRNGGISDSAVKTQHLESALGGVSNTRRKVTSLQKLVEKLQ